MSSSPPRERPRKYSLFEKTWRDYRGLLVFAIGLLPIYLLSRLGWPNFQGYPILSTQLSQLAGTGVTFLMGALFGAIPVVLLFLFIRFFDIALAIFGLLILYLVLAPGAGSVMPYFAGMIGFVSGIIGAWLFLFGFPRLPKATTFGSAEWADAEHLKKAELFEGQGFWLGTFDVPSGDRRSPPEPELIRYNGDRHLLTIAPTRSGKGVSAIIPNLLTYKGSAIVVDPKGENARLTTIARLRMNQKVHIVDPWGIVTGELDGRLNVACYNPLDWLQPEDPEIGENAMMLADAIVVQNPNSKEPFWDEEAKALLMGFILHVATHPSEAHQRHLGRVRDMLMLKTDDFDALLTTMLTSDNPIVVATAARILGKDPKLLSSVMASVQSHTHFLDSPKIRANLMRSDFQFSDLKTTPSTVFLVLPADRLNTFSRWLRLLIQQAITVNARNIHLKPKQSILFMLDEMAALGRLSMVEQAYGLMAGFGMQMWGIVQDASQLKKIYDEGWETFISNSGCITYYGSRDVMTAEYFSKLAGVATVTTFGRSVAQAVSSKIGSGTSTTTTTTEGETKRNLATPDELMRLQDLRQLILLENLNPIQSTRIRYYEHPILKPLAIDLIEAVRQQVAREAAAGAQPAPARPSTPPPRGGPPRPSRPPPRPPRSDGG